MLSTLISVHSNEHSLSYRGRRSIERRRPGLTDDDSVLELLVTGLRPRWSTKKGTPSPCIRGRLAFFSYFVRVIVVLSPDQCGCVIVGNPSDEREKQSELIGLLCGCLQVIIQKLGSSKPTKYVFLQYADQIMGLFYKVFACRNATAHKEAMLAIGALAYAIGADFAKYMPEFYRFLEMDLQNFEDYQFCAVTVGVVGDLCRALEDKILPYCDGIMTQLLKNLSSDNLHRSVKPPLFSCIGDIALAIGENFNKYLMYAMNTLQLASELYAHTSGFDDERTEYINSLKNGILEAYSGIFQGFKNSSKTQLLIPYAPHILQFLDSIYMEKDMDEVVMKTAIGVLGDLADTLGSNAGYQIVKIQLTVFSPQKQTWSEFFLRHRSEELEAWLPCDCDTCPLRPPPMLPIVQPVMNFRPLQNQAQAAATMAI
ncbi:Importin [Arachis hypogaea]|uniref:Importin n=1 Tax=Arachis hypogaea TaxID=3818 RepID=A0A6B9V6I8_ARAHY|nr:Importin [Arachis hypogaea]